MLGIKYTDLGKTKYKRIESFVETGRIQNQICYSISLEKYGNATLRLCRATNTCWVSWHTGERLLCKIVKSPIIDWYSNIVYGN